MKKVLSLILAAVMLLGCMSITAFAENEEELFDETINFTEQDVPGAVYETMHEMHEMVDKVAAITTISTEHFTIDFTNAFCSKMERIDEYSGEVMVMDRRMLEMSASSDITISSTDGKQTITKVEIKNGYYNSTGTANGQYFTPRDENVTVEANNGNLIFSNINSDEITITSCWYQQNGILQIKVYYTQSEEPENDFLTSFTLNKDYNDKYTADTKSAKVNETLTYTIAPVTANAPAFANGGVVTMNVANGVGAVDVTLPTATAAGEYWYTLKENAGTTAGVTYDAGTYYLHLVTYLKDGEYGVVSAALHTTAPAADGTYKDDDKITTITNTYGEGKLTVTEEALLNGAPNTEDTFTETVTFTSDKAVTGNITYGDNKTITPDMWQNGSVSVDIDLKGGESIVFENIPDGVTYNVVQKTKADGYDDATYTIDDEDGDEATATGITGTISDKADTATVHNEKNLPIDVGVILENGAFIVIAIGALALGAWLVLSKKKEREYDAE